MGTSLTAKEVVKGAWNLLRAKTKPVTPNSSMRLQTCMKCERLERVSLRCQECGCPVKELTKLQDKQCPLAYW